MIKKYLLCTVSLVVLLAIASCSSGNNAQPAAKPASKSASKQNDEIGKAFANEPYKITVTGGDVIATKKNPLVEHISIRPGDLNKLASSQSPFATLGFNAEVVKNSQGVNDGVRLTQIDGAGSAYGFKDRDVIVGVNRIHVTSVATVNKIFARISKEGMVDITIRRGSTPHKIILSKAEK